MACRSYRECATVPFDISNALFIATANDLR